MGIYSQKLTCNVFPRRRWVSMNPQLGITPMMLRCTGQVGYWSSCIMRVTVLALNVPSL